MTSTTEGIHLGERASLSVKNMGYLSSNITAENSAAIINLGDSNATIGKTDSPLFSTLMRGYNAVLQGNIMGAPELSEYEQMLCGTLDRNSETQRS